MALELVQPCIGMRVEGHGAEGALALSGAPWSGLEFFFSPAASEVDWVAVVLKGRPDVIVVADPDGQPGQIPGFLEKAGVRLLNVLGEGGQDVRSRIYGVGPARQRCGFGLGSTFDPVLQQLGDVGFGNVQFFLAGFAPSALGGLQPRAFQDIGVGFPDVLPAFHQAEPGGLTVACRHDLGGAPVGDGATDGPRCSIVNPVGVHFQVAGRGALGEVEILEMHSHSAELGLQVNLRGDLGDKPSDVVLQLFQVAVEGGRVVHVSALGEVLANYSAVHWPVSCAMPLCLMGGLVEENDTS